MTPLCRRLPTAGAASPLVHVRRQHPSPPAAICDIRRFHKTERPGFTLRVRLRRHLPVLLAEATGHGGAWERSVDGEEEENARPRVGELEPASGRESVNRTAEVVAAAAVTVVIGVGNRVMYKLALVPLKQYPFFLAQLATIGAMMLILTQK